MEHNNTNPTAEEFEAMRKDRDDLRELWEGAARVARELDAEVKKWQTLWDDSQALLKETTAKFEETHRRLGVVGSSWDKQTTTLGNLRDYLAELIKDETITDSDAIDTLVSDYQVPAVRTVTVQVSFTVDLEVEAPYNVDVEDLPFEVTEIYCGDHDVSIFNYEIESVTEL